MTSVTPDAFPATEHHRPLIGTKLYCLMTDARGCLQLAQSCCLAVLSGSKVSHKTHTVYMNFIYKHFSKRKQNVNSSL